MSACSADIYGHNRTGGDERPLVVAGDSMQGDDLDGAGPWLVYEDQRDAPTPTRDVDREDNIYALYLPTMTELPIVTWPGSDGTPRAYRRTDGTYGLLFTQEIDYWDATYRLWDCDLPEPPAP
jgi:hypothetical protein